MKKWLKTKLKQLLCDHKVTKPLRKLETLSASARDYEWVDSQTLSFKRWDTCIDCGKILTFGFINH